MRVPNRWCTTSCTLIQASRVRPAAIHDSTISCAHDSGRSKSCLSNSVTFSSWRMRSVRSFSSQVALSKTRNAKREDKILFSTMSLPISSNDRLPLVVRTDAVGGSMAFFQAAAVELSHTLSLFWYVIHASRRSCDSRALALWSSRPFRRVRTMCAASLRISMALAKYSSRACLAKEAFAIEPVGPKVATVCLYSY